MEKKIKTPITWYGGKQKMLQHILPLIPEHKVYTESFFGGGAVFFSKVPSQCEVINDVNREAVNFYSVVVKDFKRLQYEVTSTLHSHAAFDDAKVIYTYPHLFDETKRAWAFYTMTRQSFSANLSTFAFDKDGKTTKVVYNKREQFVEAIKDRLAKTTIECDDAVKVIKRYDSDSTFHYVDPPYFNSDCGHYAGYSEADFIKLLDMLTKVKGKFMLSSYPSDVLAKYTKANKWFTVSVEKKVAVTKATNKTKIEVITANYKL